MDAFLKLARYSFVTASIDYAPHRQGVYGLFDLDDLIYIGGTNDLHETIRACLTNHAAGAHGECTKNATRYTWEVTRFAGDRIRELLAQFSERHRRNPRCHAKDVR